MSETELHPVRVLRDALDMKPAQIAERISRTRSFIVQVEAGDAELGRESVLRLFDEFRDALNRLGITAEDLLRGTRARPVVPSGEEDCAPAQ